MLAKLLYTLVLGSTLCSMACTRQPVPDGKKTREQFVASIHAFPYRAPAERKAQVVGGYPRLTVGMDKSQIAEIVGEPDYSGIVAGKALLNHDERGSEWVYCLYSANAFVGTSQNDEHLTIFFDLDDRARWIIPRGLNGLMEIGGPWGGS